METLSVSGRLLSNEINRRKTASITASEKIAYMMKFYPIPKFVQITFDDTQDSSNPSDHSQECIEESKSESRMYLTAQKSTPKNQSIGAYGLSQIKSRNFGFDFYGKKFRQNGKRSAIQTDFDYQELIGQLSFQNTIPQKNHFSAQKDIRKLQEFETVQQNNTGFAQKNTQRLQEFEQFEEKDILIKYEKKGNKDSQIEYRNRKVSIKQKSVKKRASKVLKSNKNFIWDSPSQIEFKKQNKLKRMMSIFNYHEQESVKEAYREIKLLTKLKFCNKCSKPIQKDEKCEICLDCKSKESSMIERQSIDQRFKVGINNEINSEIYQ